VRQARHPARFDKTPASVSRPAPRLGEHGREILAAIGYDDEAIESLISAGRVLG
jgi:crotonobetainyl-CoA:carnitine CoA-transferase CaiB-like acyl-CoA transferase